MIDFISAFAGGVQLTVADKGDYWASNAKDLAAFIEEFGLARCVMCSSSMDFASEEGFASDDAARKLFDEACVIAGV